MLEMRRAALAVVLSVFLPGSAFAASPAPIKAENGMVVTAQHLASRIGVEVMKEGGNAVDAAVAVGYALAVAWPSAGNIGGGGFMTIRFKDGTSTFLDFRERAPLAATKNMYLDKDGKPVEGLSLDGYLAVGVPGSVAGFEMAREKFGSKSRADLMAPAIKLAKEGFVLNQGDADMLARNAKRLAKDKAAAQIFLKADGKPYAEGETLVQADLGVALASISSRKAPSRAASSPKPTSSITPCASSSLSPAPIAVMTSSPRRRQARAASSSARSSMCWKAIRSPIWASARPRRCI